MFISDYHTHTNYSPDSTCSVKDRLKWAIENGIEEICFTDHVDSFHGDNYATNFDYDKYRKEILLETSKLKDKITIKYGMEIGLFPHLKDEADRIIKAQDLDFVIGSTHSVHKRDLYDYREFFKDKDKIIAYHQYFEQILLNVQTLDNFDVHGHLDFVYRYGGYSEPMLNYLDHKEIIDTILKTLIEKGKGIEINLSGPRYGSKHFYPSYDIVKAYKELGGEIITIGSDTHEKQYIRELILQAQQQLKDVGFDYVTTFNKRKPSFTKI